MRSLMNLLSTCAMPLLATVALSLAVPPSLAASPPLTGKRACEAKSAATRIAVLELYTSEGCSSCPPADRWVSTLPANGFSVDRLIPLAFHVDYWDQLGWPDRMAKAQFSSRQRVQAQRNRANTIYTPQLLLNGADYRHSSLGGGFEDRVRTVNRLPAAADLHMVQRPTSAGVDIELDVRLAQSARGQVTQTYFAITENRLQNNIKAGENGGKLLNHDFVVRELVGPLLTDRDGRLQWNSALTQPRDWKRADLSFAAFVQDVRSGDILQALHAPLCSDS